MMKRRILFAATAVALLQIGFLASMIAGRAAILRDGATVVLEVRPVDPRDLLRGDYVVLGYDISRLDAALLEGNAPEDGVERGRTVHVRLKPTGEGAWEAVAASFDDKPEAQSTEGEVDIRGRMARAWRPDNPFLDVDYGIERYYVPEGEGRAIEAGIAERSFTVHVAVAEDGTAQIKSLHDGARLLYEEPLY